MKQRHFQIELVNSPCCYNSVWITGGGEEFIIFIHLFPPPLWAYVSHSLPFPPSCRRCVHPLPSTRSLFFHSRRDYRPTEGRIEAKHRQLGLRRQLQIAYWRSPVAVYGWIVLGSNYRVVVLWVDICIVQAPQGCQPFCVAILHCRFVHRHANKNYDGIRGIPMTRQF